MILRVALAMLATWRITQWIVLDDGPFDWLFILRYKLGRYTFSKDEEGVSEPVSAIGRLLECAHCVGKWVGLVMALLVIYPSKMGDLFLIACACAAVQSLIEGPRSCHDEAVRVRRSARRRDARNGDSGT